MVIGECPCDVAHAGIGTEFTRHRPLSQRRWSRLGDRLRVLPTKESSARHRRFAKASGSSGKAELGGTPARSPCRRVRRFETRHTSEGRQVLKGYLRDARQCSGHGFPRGTRLSARLLHPACATLSPSARKAQAELSWPIWHRSIREMRDSAEAPRSRSTLEARALAAFPDPSISLRAGISCTHSRSDTYVVMTVMARPRSASSAQNVVRCR